MSSFNCPHCKNEIKIIKGSASRPSAGGRFDSTAVYNGSQQKRPSTVLGWCLWVIFGEGRLLPDPPSNLVRVEVDLRTADNQMKFNGGLLPLPIEKLRPVAMLYAFQGAKWNRANNTRAGLSQTDHHKLKYFLLDVGLLDVVNSREYKLNRAGLLCMRHITRL